MGMDLARHRRGVVAVLRALVVRPMIKLIPHLPTRMEMVVVEEEEGEGARGCILCTDYARVLGRLSAPPIVASPISCGCSSG